MKEMEAAVLDTHEGRTQPRGVVRLHAPRPAYAHHVAPVLGLLRQEVPDVVLDLSVDDSPVQASAVGYDLVIRRGASIDGGWESLSLGAELRHAVIASPAYLAQSETPTLPDDLSRHRCIQWRPIGSDTQAWQFECDGQTTNIAVSGPLVVSHCDAAITAALQGVGIAYVLESYARTYTDDGRLVPLLSQFLPPFAGWKVCYAKNIRPSPAALAVAAVLTTAAP